MAKADYFFTGRIVFEIFLCSIVWKLLLADNENSKKHTVISLHNSIYTAIEEGG